MSAVSQRPGPSLVASGRTQWSSATFDLLNITGSVWIVILMLAICLDVIGRTTLARPIDGIAEFSALSIVCIVFMQLPDAIASRRLTRADALLARLMQSHPAFGLQRSGSLSACLAARRIHRGRRHLHVSGLDRVGHD